MVKRHFLLVLTVFLLVLYVNCGGDAANADIEGMVSHLTCWIVDMELDRLIERFEGTNPGITIKANHHADHTTDYLTALSHTNVELATGWTIEKHGIFVYQKTDSERVLPQNRLTMLNNIYHYIQHRDEFGNAPQFVGSPSNHAYDLCLASKYNSYQRWDPGKLVSRDLFRVRKNYQQSLAQEGY